MKRTLVILSAFWIGLSGVRGQTHSVAERPIDGRDGLLAALGTATLECLGTVGPSSYSTSAGVLERTFKGCRSGDRQALRKVDALLALQVAERGRLDDIGGHFVSRWNAFLESFERGNDTQCPLWHLESVIDAPTRESIPRSLSPRRIGKENYRYTVSSSQCSNDGGCATRLAAQCARGFGPAFIVDRDPGRSRIEVDPLWWLTTYTFMDDADNPFRMPGYYHPMSYYGALPGSLYGTIQRAGEACSQWDESSKKHYTNRQLVPIDCGGGWVCMTYCMLPPSPVSPPDAW